MQVPSEIYRGCGRAWAAIAGGKVVALRYMGAMPLPTLADLGRKRMTKRARIELRDLETRQFGEYRAKCRAELAQSGEVVSGMCSGTEFLPGV